MPLQLLPSEHAAQEVEDARVVRLKSDEMTIAGSNMLLIS